MLTALVYDAPSGDAATLPVVSFPSTVLGQVEGNAGSANVTVTAMLSQAATSTVTIPWATANGTATVADLDYIASSGTLTFPPGSTSQNLTMTVNGDTKLEDYQRFTVKLATRSAREGPRHPDRRDPQRRAPETRTRRRLGDRGRRRSLPTEARTGLLPGAVTDGPDVQPHRIAPGDYGATSAPVTFAAGSKVGTAVNVPTVADGVTEAKETFALTVAGSGVAAPLTKLATIAANTGSAGATCNTGQAAPTNYEKVVVFSFENRSWTDVGGVGFTGMPYAKSLATSCAYFTTWTEANTGQNSATQYVSQGQGDTNHTVLNDCAPSATCQSTSDNIFRQVRTAGKTAINYVEGATAPCSASGNAAKHIPALYYRGADDAGETAPHRFGRTPSSIPRICRRSHSSRRRSATTGTTASTQPSISGCSRTSGR